MSFLKIKILNNKQINNFINNFKYKLKNLLLNLGYPKYINYKNYQYDKKIFYTSSSVNFKLDFKRMNKEQFSAYLIYIYHKVEKGL